MLLLILARESPHHCTSRSPQADHSHHCPCSIVILNMFSDTWLLIKMFFWRPFPLCALLYSASTHWHPSVLNISLEKDALSRWQQSKLFSGLPSLAHLWTAFSTANLTNTTGHWQVETLVHEHRYAGSHFHLGIILPQKTEEMETDKTKKEEW